MKKEEFEKKLAEKCEEIGLKVSDLSTSMLAEIEDQIHEEHQTHDAKQIKGGFLYVGKS